MERNGRNTKKKWKKWQNEGCDSSSEENEDCTLNLEEIKAKVEKLKSELKTFKENSDKAKDEVRKEKGKLKELKSQNPIDTNVIIETKKAIKEKKANFWSIFKEVKSRRNKIHRLQRLAEFKVTKECKN